MSMTIKQGKTQAQRERSERKALEAQVFSLQQVLGDLMVQQATAAAAATTGKEGNA